jgi:hypothetical protein
MDDLPMQTGRIEGDGFIELLGIIVLEFLQNFLLCG